MVARLNRQRPLPEVAQPRVSESATQRAFDLLFVPLREVIRFLQPFVQKEKWKVLPYFGDWVRDLATLQEPQYRKNPFGDVRLRGWAASATGTQSVIAVLPEGYRPPARISFDQFRLTGGAYALIRLDVDVDGRVFVVSPAMPAAAIEVSLDGIEFSTEE